MAFNPSTSAGAERNASHVEMNPDAEQGIPEGGKSMGAVLPSVGAFSNPVTTGGFSPSPNRIPYDTSEPKAPEGIRR